MVLWMFITAQLLWTYGVMGVYYCSPAVGICSYGCSLLLNCCGHMVLRMLITAQLLWAYGVMDVRYCSTAVGIWCVTGRRIGESNGTSMEQGDRNALI